MSSEAHVKRGHPISFGILTLFSIIAVAISTWLVNTFNKNHNYPNGSVRDKTRFLLFLSWWTMIFSILFLVFFQVASASPITSIASHGTWIILTWVMWTIGVAVYTAALGGGLDCGNPDTFLHCPQLNALEAFSWIIWIILTFLLVVIVLLGARGMRRGDRFSGSVAA